MTLHHAPGSWGPDPRHSPEPPASPSIGRPGVVAVLSGAAALATLVVVHGRVEDDAVSSYELGRLLVPALGGGLLGFLVARARPRVPWPAVVLAVAVAAAGYGLVTTLVPRWADDVRAGVNGQSSYVVEAPADVADWHRSSDGDDRAETVVAGLPQRVRDNGEAVFGTYERAADDARLVFLGINASGVMEDDLRDAAGDVLDDLMRLSDATRTVEVEAGDLGGEMACVVEEPALPANVVMCGWADASTVGQVYVSIPDLAVEAAAALVRDFRGTVTTRDG